MKPRHLFGSPKSPGTPFQPYSRRYAQSRNVYGVKKIAGKRAASFAQKAYRGWNKYGAHVGAAATAGYWGYRGARYLYKKLYPGPNKRVGIASGRSVGKFKRPKRVKPDPYNGRGFVHTTEVVGTVTDPKCVYVGHGTTVSSYAIEHVAHCLLRNLFESSGVIKVESVGQAIDSSIDRLAGYKIRYTTKDMSTGTLDSHTHTLADGQSIFSLVGEEMTSDAPDWAEFIVMLKNYAAGNGRESAYNVIEPVFLDLLHPTPTATSPSLVITDLVAKRINLRDCFVNYSVSSTMKIQNRTLASTGGDEADNVGSNPISGKMYHFSSGAPRIRGSSGHAFSGILERNGGVIVTGASAMPTGYDLREPPDGKFWWNCNKAGGILINPGEIKTDTIRFSKKMPLLKFISAIGRNTADNTGTNGFKNVTVIGQSAMFALEDVINLNADNNILIAYEVDRKTKMFITQSPKKFALGTLYEHSKAYAP